LPHFSRVRIFAPKRMGLYLVEAAKFVCWVLLPISIVMIFMSEHILYAFMYLTGKLRLEQVAQGSNILIAFLLGLVFFSLNKILLNIYYAFRNTWIPTLILAVATFINYRLNVALMKILFSTGIALSTTISAVIQSVLFLSFLYVAFGIRFYFGRFFDFAWRYLLNLFVVFLTVFLLYSVVMGLVRLLPLYAKSFLTSGLGVWVWAAPLCLLVFLMVFWTRKLFKIKLYFLD